MNGTRFNITLSEGCWKRSPTPGAVRDRLTRGVFYGLEVVWDETEPFGPGADAVLQLSVVCPVINGEILRDCIIERLLHYFEPEYESMVEVEVLDE